MMMKNVAIATDSHSSITPETAQTLGVAVLPMPFTIDGTCYLEEETLTRAEFYAHQRRGAKIATSQPAPADVTALWDNLLTDHDEVVYIPISSGCPVRVRQQWRWRRMRPTPGVCSWWTTGASRRRCM